jgi:ATP diphosphatase
VSSIEKLLDVMRQLRDPETGCAWDIEQTFETIAPYTIEEAYEVADAIERNDLSDLQDELGDLLLQVVFHAQMASEQGSFAFDDVVNSIVDKMVRRHPHVFGDAKFANEAELKASWEASKAAERAGKSEDTSALADIAVALPALKRADKIQKRAARVGFDWPDVAPVWDKLQEETHEVQEALANDDAAAVQDEIGDLLFTMVNLARHVNVDAETALVAANNKFEKRFRQVEQLASKQQDVLSELSLSELDALWDKAKTTLGSE